MAGVFDVPQTSWTTDDVLHFARRAGFHLKPEAAQALVAGGPAAAVSAWISASADETAYLQARSTKGDVYYDADVDGSNQGPHGFTIRPIGSISEAQGHTCFSLMFNPNQAKERIALFWHQFFATGAAKVDNPTLMANQFQLFRDMGRGAFPDLLKAVSHDPAMLRWLDGIANSVDGSGKAPNENYAREVMELYSLGPYNGYGEPDIKAMAQLFAGWTFYASGSELFEDSGQTYATTGHAVVAMGQANPVNAPLLLDGLGDTLAANEKLPERRVFPANAAVTLFGSQVPVMGADFGDNALALITTTRSTECAQFLARRLLRHFLAPESDLSATVFNDFAATLKASHFDIGACLTKLFTSQEFYRPQYRYCLVEGPVAWMIRQARALCPDLAKALATPLNGTPGVPSFPVFAGAQNSDEDEQIAWYTGFAGQKLLNPKGPNGWAEHLGWINSNAAQYRSRLAAALAYGPTDFTGDGRDHPGSPTVGFFPTGDISLWFPSKPAGPTDVWNRLMDLLQPAPIPAAARDQLLTGDNGLWGPGQTFAAWNATDQRKARDLAFLILSSPQAQVH
ncbi:DUF1800 family protein [Geothrix sp. PMB-07]|uniref:DUF1800 family protein n=1 Tax=Geothrix sp. PMB-07 TaxID=3068640 RepID=UPI0027403BC2|nr:DUF1800 family protein [Geothrix sp. PMB-07]WLT32809.1 DUF1800 family protein [Geothrix sp. PMB-07]